MKGKMLYIPVEKIEPYKGLLLEPLLHPERVFQTEVFPANDLGNLSVFYKIIKKSDSSYIFG